MNFEFLIPVIVSFVISVCLCPIFIPFLKRLKFGQYIREEGPQSHQKKSGTPTMGGLIIVISVIINFNVFCHVIVCLFLRYTCFQPNQSS